MTIYEDIARNTVRDVGFVRLVCKFCKKTRDEPVKDFAFHLQFGFPKCCHLIMTLEKYTDGGD